MNKLLFGAMLSATLLSCKDDELQSNGGRTKASTWQLTEVLADPGDGSGTFNAVESNKTIVFYNDGTLSSNGSLCDMSIASDNASTGTYSISESTISASGCNHTLSFQQNDSIMILTYPCIEPCRAKYERVN